MDLYDLKKNMTESFKELFEATQHNNQIIVGSIINVTVAGTDSKYVYLDTPLKARAKVDIEQFKKTDGSSEVEVGEETQCFIEAFDDGCGSPVLSRKKAKDQEIFVLIEQAHEKGEFLNATILAQVKGGCTVTIQTPAGTASAFLPRSLSLPNEISRGGTIYCRPVKVDKQINSIIVTQRQFDNTKDRDPGLELSELQVGQIVSGIVKNLTTYGAFIRLGQNVDGLLHISHMCENGEKITSPHEKLSIGQSIDVKILQIENDRVSLGLNQKCETDIEKRFPIDMVVNATIVEKRAYGFMAELAPGVRGLIHKSEIDWFEKNPDLDSFPIEIGDVKEVAVKEVKGYNRISLSIKACTPNPWEKFEETHSQKIGQTISGVVKRVVIHFGLFVTLEGGVEGLVHISDIARDKNAAEEKLKAYSNQIGENIDVILIKIDKERSRISLRVKQQIVEDRCETYFAQYKKGDTLSGKVLNISDTIVEIEIAAGVLGHVPVNAGEADLTTLEVGKIVNAKYVGFDKNQRVAILSTKELSNTASETSSSKSTKKQEQVQLPSAMAEAFKAAKGSS